MMQATERFMPTPESPGPATRVCVHGRDQRFDGAAPSAARERSLWRRAKPLHPFHRPLMASEILDGGVLLRSSAANGPHTLRLRPNSEDGD
jgi:hypothetical protein